MIKNLANRGFSLVETMVAVGISGVMALALATLLTDVARVFYRADVNTEIDGMVKNLQNVVVNPDGCSIALYSDVAGNNLVTFTGGSTPVRQIKYKLPPLPQPQVQQPAWIEDDPDFRVLRGKDNNSGVWLDSVTLRQLGGAPAQRTIVNLVSRDTYRAQLDLRFIIDRDGDDAPDSDVVGGGVRPKTIPIMVTTDTAGGGNLSCEVGASAGEMCDSLGGTLNTDTGECENIPFLAQDCSAVDCNTADVNIPGSGPLVSPADDGCYYIPSMVGFDTNTDSTNCQCFKVCTPAKPAPIPIPDPVGGNRTAGGSSTLITILGFAASGPTGPGPGPAGTSAGGAGGSTGFGTTGGN